jgi:hypothetical protein
MMQLQEGRGAGGGDDAHKSVGEREIEEVVGLYQAAIDRSRAVAEGELIGHL